MKSKNAIKNMTLTAVCIALCVVLPIAFHSIPDAGSVFLPMHIPVLICGMICGWPYGFICGLMGPLLSSALTGMVSGIMLKLVHTKSTYGDLYIALVVAMLAGRVMSGIAKALIFMPGISMTAWITASFITALHGILIQLVFLPSVVLTLMKAKIIPVRYAKGKAVA